MRTLNGVQWFNDSIATSPTRVIAGLRAFDQKLIIIAGGSDKGISFAPLAPELIAHVKTLILTGSHRAENRRCGEGGPRLCRKRACDFAGGGHASGRRDGQSGAAGRYRVSFARLCQL